MIGRHPRLVAAGLDAGVRVSDQADAGCDYITRYLDLAGDRLIPGLDVVTFVGDVAF